MEQNEALKILVEVALLAQARGILTLDDAVKVRDAIKVFASEEEKKEE